jgi:hypothetical protein
MTIVHELIAQAAQAGAEATEVEYKDGCEEVVAMRGPVGFGIASFRSVDANAEALRQELYGMAKRRTAITVDEVDYDVCVRVFDSFGEDAFRVEFKETTGGPDKRAAPDRGHGAVRTKPAASRSAAAGERRRSSIWKTTQWT